MNAYKKTLHFFSISPGVLLFIFLGLVQSCISLYVPDIDDHRELLVVQGMITDNTEPDTIKLFRSLPLGKIAEAQPVKGCTVTISDNLGNRTLLGEIFPGTYITPDNFIGIPGLSYTLNITDPNSINYRSDPAEMIPVPDIDSLYYEKITIDEPSGFYKGVQHCQIYLDSNDPENKCRYFKWDFNETWMFRLNFAIPNRICYLYNYSQDINIKSTAAFTDSRILRQPIKYIDQYTDRLMVRYTILVNQYSLNEEEFVYWEKMQNIFKNVGGLYDMIPASLPNNLHCIENPEEEVLGYFSVSAQSSKRIFIEDRFAGIIDRFSDCIIDTVTESKLIGLNESIWILFRHGCTIPCVTTFEITDRRECADCTLRGTPKKPDFWIDE